MIGSRHFRWKEYLNENEALVVESRSVVPLLRSGMLFFLMYISTAEGVGQEYKLINQPRRASPFAVVIYTDHHTAIVEEELLKYKDRNGTSLLLVGPVTPSSTAVVIDSINQRLNYQEGIDLQRCYLLVLGEEELYQEYKTFDANHFFSKKIFLSSDPMGATEMEFDFEQLSNVRLKDEIETFTDHYLWEIKLSQIEEQNVSDLNQNAIESGIRITADAVFPFYSGLEHSVKPFFRTFSAGVYHRWGRSWQTNLDYTAGLNLPSSNRIQNELQPSISSGDEVELDIQAHVLQSINLEMRYLFPAIKKKIHPYLGARVGMTSIRFTETTIELDPSDLLSGSPPRQDAFDNDDFQRLESPTVGLTSGLQMAVSPKWAIEAGIRWNQDVASLEKNELYFNSISFSMGFHFRFTGKKELYYDYIKTH